MAVGESDQRCRERWWLESSVVVTLLVMGAAAHAATVQTVRAWSGPEGTRVVFELSGPAEHRVFALADPDRVVIDLPEQLGAQRPASRRAEGRRHGPAKRALGPAASCGSCSS